MVSIMYLKKLPLQGNFCTCFPERIGKWIFQGCCFDHDDDFYNPNMTFMEANKKFYRCLKEKTNGFWALLMFLGVSSPVGLALWLKAQWEVKKGRV